VLHVRWKNDSSETKNETNEGAGVLVLGSLTFAGGATLSSFGGVRYRRFLNASEENGIDYPHNGAGRMTAGIMLVGGGAQLLGMGIIGVIMSIFATPYPADGEGEETGLGYFGAALVMAGVGVVAIPVGAVLLHFGIKQRRRQQAFWKSGWYTLVPSVAPTVGGATFGVAGRF
jgi:hypothetical protein